MKLAVSGGDIKSVQRDLADKTVDMVLKTYSRSLSTNRNNMNDRFDEAFYGKNPCSHDSRITEADEMNTELLRNLVIEKLDNPDILEKLLKLIGNPQSMLSSNSLQYMRGSKRCKELCKVSSLKVRKMSVGLLKVK